jgi:hypothetical protein
MKMCVYFENYTCTLDGLRDCPCRDDIEIGEIPDCDCYEE